MSRSFSERLYLEQFAPAFAFLLNYSIVLWLALTVLQAIAFFFNRPARTGQIFLVLTIATQITTAITFSFIDVVPPFSLSATAQEGDLAALLYLLQLIAYCIFCAGYTAVMLLRLSRQTKDLYVRLGQQIAVVGLAVFVVAAAEETLFLLGDFIPMRLHGLLVSGVTFVGVFFFVGGVLLWSPYGRRLAQAVVDAFRYTRLRPLGRRLKKTWPNLCLADYSRWALLNPLGARARLSRLFADWADVRWTLPSYLPDEEIPSGEQPDVEIEALYLLRGLTCDTSLPRAKAGNQRQLPPLPVDLDAAIAFLLRVQKQLGQLEQGGQAVVAEQRWGEAAAGPGSRR